MITPLLHRHPGRLPRLLSGFPHLCRSISCTLRRDIVVLGIETSCDDTSVALLERTSTNCPPGGDDCPKTTLLFHRTVTSDNLPTRGIHPLTSLSSHRTHLAPLLVDALEYLPRACSRPDIVAATRGPGMRASLAAGLDVAKGLAVAWGVPLIGVNHMLGHALTARLVSALGRVGGGGGGGGPSGCVDAGAHDEPRPRFPFWSLLVSGGHTLVVRSESVMRHWVACETVDIAVGDMLDKVARMLVPEESISRDDGSAAGVAYGRVLEEFAFPRPRNYKERHRGDQGGDSYDLGYDYEYYPPGTALREAQEAAFAQKYSTWSPLPVPFMSTGSKHHVLEFSFSGIGSSVERALKRSPEMDEEERRHLARQVMQVAFEHLAKRFLLASREHQRRTRQQGGINSSADIDIGSGVINYSCESAQPEKVVVQKQTLVLSGGVAANSFLRHLLKSYLSNEGLLQLELICPPPKLCTDNAAMIAWAGLEIWEGGVGVGIGIGERGDEQGKTGWVTELGCHPVRKWSLDSTHEGNSDNAYGSGGIDGVTLVGQQVPRVDPGDAMAKGMFGVDSWVSRQEWEKREMAQRHTRVQEKSIKDRRTL